MCWGVFGMQENRNFSRSADELKELAGCVLGMSARHGATECDVDITESMGSGVTVRLGALEAIESRRDTSVTVRVYFGKRKGHATTTDLSHDALEQAVAAAVRIARLSAEDSCAGLAETAAFATAFPELDLYHPWHIATSDAIDIAARCENAALSVDRQRIPNSDGAAVASHIAQSIYANSLDFVGYRRGSRHTVSCAVIAQENGSMQRDKWYTHARAVGDLEDVVDVGNRAGKRALARLHPRRISTEERPVLFESGVAAGLVNHFASAINGLSLYSGSSFLANSLGQQIFSPIVNIVEDPLLPRGLASAAFDAEGVATRRRNLLQDGVVTGYLLSTYTARKLGLKTTGNAGGVHNLMVTPTAGGHDDMLQKLGTGLFITELAGQGVNNMTGEYSRGASGFWVENGVVAFPVEGITISGNLRNMYKRIAAIGSDVDRRSGIQVGSILIDGVSIAGT